MKKKYLVIQSELPLYRDFLWDGLRETVSLYIYNDKENFIIDPEKNIVNPNVIKKVTFDYLIISSGLRDTYKYFSYRRKISYKKVVGWSQLLGRRKGVFALWVKSIYLNIFFDACFFYYDYEVKKIPFKSLKRKSIGLNNTVKNINHKFLKDSSSNVNGKKFLFIGRYTQKSNLDILIKVFNESPHINLKIIGVNKEDLPFESGANIEFFDFISSDLNIIDISLDCSYFIYPGDVGLSIIHALKLGLMPIIHNNFNNHMPEATAASNNFPVITFQENDEKSLRQVIDSSFNTIEEFNKDKISSEANLIFSETDMIKNFIL